MENDSTDGELKSKRLRVSPEFELDDKVSSNRDDDYPEVGETSTSQEVCFMEQLPVEILEMIFTRLKQDYAEDVLGKEFKTEKYVNLRLVCKRWCNILSKNRNVYFRGTVPHAPFENYGFERFSLQLWDVDLSELPLSTWEKIGCKVNSLILRCCTIGDQGLKDIIVYCCNLQSLKVFLKNNGDTADPFCSPDMLRGLQITRKNLGTFEIFNTLQKTVDVTKWIQVFEVFFKVFPNVTHFTSGCGEDPEADETFQFKFLKELYEDDACGIAASLAFSLSTNQDHHRQALNASSSLRLSDVSVHLWKTRRYNNEDETTLTKFFSSHKNLKCVEVILNRESLSGSLKTLPFKILEHCSNLHKLMYFESHCCHLDCAHILSEHEFFRLCTTCKHLEELSINYFKLLINRSSLSTIFYPVCLSQLKFVILQSLWEQHLQSFVTTYPNLQHLDVQTYPCTDDMLQKIFKHLIYLKTLSIKVTIWNTNRGITGRCGDAPGVCTIREPFNCKSWNQDTSKTILGYSINRLKNLEELTIFPYSRSDMNDTIFYEFVFPKLRSLTISFPDDPSKLLPVMGKNMPSLEEINFGSRYLNYESREDFEKLAESVVSFCQFTKKLREIFLGKTSEEYSLSESEIMGIFNVCPSLHLLIEDDYKVCYHDPITQKVVSKVCRRRYGRWQTSERWPQRTSPLTENLPSDHIQVDPSSS